MKKILLSLLFFCIAVISSFAATSLKVGDSIVNPPNADNLQPIKIKGVIDGDTVYVWREQYYTRARLEGIDCMETKEGKRAYYQAYKKDVPVKDIIKQGKSAKKELKKIVKENDYELFYKDLGKDYYERMLVILYDKNMQNINEMMKNTPYCINYEFKPKTKK